MNLNLIFCSDRRGGIGKENMIPWKSKVDMKFFRNKTVGDKKNAVVMGYNTWLSLGCKPLKDRINIVLTNSHYHLCSKNSSIVAFSTLDNLFEFLENTGDTFDDIYVIGGAFLYNVFLDPSSKYNRYVKYVYHNVIDKDYDCDTFVETGHLANNTYNCFSMRTLDEEVDSFVYKNNIAASENS